MTQDAGIAEHLITRNAIVQESVGNMTNMFVTPMQRANTAAMPCMQTDDSQTWL